MGKGDKRKQEGDERKREKKNHFCGGKKRVAWNKKMNTIMDKRKREYLKVTDRGSYYNQEVWMEEQWDKNFGIYSNEIDIDDESYYLLSENDFSDSGDSTSESKIENNVTVDVTPDNGFNIPCGYAIVCPQILQAMISDRAICKVCHGSLLRLKEKYSACQSLGRVWTLQCENLECSEHASETWNMTPKKDKFFEVNRALVLALRSVGRGRSSATKITSLLNLPAPINARSWAEHTRKISDQCQILSERNMKEEAFNTKLHLRNTGQIGWVDDDELRQQVVDVSMSLDGS